MNWKSLFFNSQSNPGLAVSGDFSDEEEEFRITEEDQIISSTSIITSCPISSESNPSSCPSSSSTSSKLKMKLKSTSPSPPPPQTLKLKLSWQRTWLLIPTYSLIFLTVLPFVQGCLYTIGYRLGRKTLKFIINKV